MHNQRRFDGQFPELRVASVNGETFGQRRVARSGNRPQRLERLSPSDESWLNLVRDFRRNFRRAAGTPESMKKEADKHGCHKMYGIGHSREIFEQPKRSTA